MNGMSRMSWGRRVGFCLLVWIGLSLAASQVNAAAKPLAITSATYNKNKAVLKVTTSVKKLTGTLSLLHGSGGILGEKVIAGKKQSFTIPLTQLGQVPCEVEARVGDQRVTKLVAGAPAECKKMPVCQILAPAAGAQLAVNTDVQFKGQAKFKDKQATGEPTYEWDFGGGTLGEDITGTGLIANYKRPDSNQTTVKFVRDNSTYRIRFAATDSNKHRCEAAVEVSVGTPPDTGLPKVAEPSAAVRGAENNGIKDDWVILPFQEWTMQHFTDMKLIPDGQVSFNATVTSLDAHVIKKGSVGLENKPKFLDGSQVDLRYSAASNPSDPVGADSINSTSQNWPLNPDPTKPAPLMAAKLQKTDLWETFERPAGPGVWSHYTSWSFIEQPFYFIWLNRLPWPGPDEGYYMYATEGERSQWDLKDIYPDYSPADLAANEDSMYGYYKGIYDANRKLLADVNPDHGRYMPGKSAPYQANDPQDFSLFVGGDKWFAANMIPITDIDDKGRVNPAPLLRVQASAKGSNSVAATTDGVLANSRDFHCRECHAKGQIAAQANKHTRAAFNWSPAAMPDGTAPLDNPDFFSVNDIGGDPNSPFDQEYAASLNYSSIHQFYDGMGFLESMKSGAKLGGLVFQDSPILCAGCHLSVTQGVNSGMNWWKTDEYDYDNHNYDPNWSMAMHRFHAELQFKDDKKDDIVRDDRGVFVRWKWFDDNNQPVPHNSTKTGSLFPIFDDQGKQLPMEQNCLRCHAGEREQCYRDRMFTAGVTCYDCHGDMAAVGQAYKKPQALQSGDGNEYRIPWFDETDCGSCHQGNAKQGKDGANGYFSAGVRRQAFDPGDPSATPFKPDLSQPDAARFAVIPEQSWEYPMSINHCPTGSRNYDNCTFEMSTQKITARLFRAGKDQHGIVACAACHGAAHGIAPNRDPKSNDNVASIQLQGYAGHLFECNVCHTKDAFNTEDSIGSILHYPDKDGKPTILAGPHNMHPVNDPNWYLNERTGATAQTNKTDGTKKGGWHSAWSGKPGLEGEDQCAACHGDDHLGSRLSKPLVDRTFDFSGFNMAKLKKAGFKSKVVKVKAGTPIGCNTCHSIQTSKLKSPTGPATVRHSPVISATPAPTAPIGASFSYQVNASDEDVGTTLVYSLAQAPDGMVIDSASGVIQWSHAPTSPDDTVSFQVQVTDNSGLSTSRWFVVKPACPSSAANWDAGLSLCTPLQITSPVPVAGIDAGQPFSYTASASSPATFTMIDSTTGQAPTFTPAISIDVNSGAIHWTPDGTTGDAVSFRIVATDGQGHQATQDISLSICQLPTHWDAGMGMCM